MARRRTLGGLLLLLLLAALATGCAGRVHIPSETVDHPANPETPGARAIAIAPLEPDAFDREEPAQYGHAANAPAATAAASYVCPMHPEVVESEPGRCPGCGMALVPGKEKK